MSTEDYTHVSLRLATADDAKLPTYDYTKLTAINTCPVWGLVRYTKHKSMPSHGRATALEAGKLLHECFAAIRLYQLSVTQGMQDHAIYHGRRMFGEERWEMLAPILLSSAPDVYAGARLFSLEVLATGGYVDDPYDKRRTYTNLETSLLYYLQRWDFGRYPIWIRDTADPRSDVGIEIPFAIRVDYYSEGLHEPNLSFLYTGRIDGIHEAASTGDVRSPTNGLLIGENKTASRLNDAWKMSFDVNHQPTGYCVAGSLFTGTPIERCLVWGLGIPLPRELSQGYALENVMRPSYMKERWLDWMYHTVMLAKRYEDDPIHAPRYTHSCNRYFRPCSLIPLCYADEDEMQRVYSEMTHDEWSPLKEETTE